VKVGDTAENAAPAKKLHTGAIPVCLEPQEVSTIASGHGERQRLVIQVKLEML